ncbi:hypothetical protein Nepgr_012090 [Nepenthes gracilis]|uniref:Uncharacterized protein n=1 Tax=Nepenthes gracilis TaxID=150966 RepID=A0AAD3SGI1_NEPGR|nr:hypothetical protein Nepgr_012090 [Nepenthes gracilis]
MERKLVHPQRPRGEIAEADGPSGRAADAVVGAKAAVAGTEGTAKVLKSTVAEAGVFVALPEVQPLERVSEEPKSPESIKTFARVSCWGRRLKYSGGTPPRRPDD